METIKTPFDRILDVLLIEACNYSDKPDKIRNNIYTSIVSGNSEIRHQIVNKILKAFDPSIVFLYDDLVNYFKVVHEGALKEDEKPKLSKNNNKIKKWFSLYVSTNTLVDDKKGFTIPLKKFKDASKDEEDMFNSLNKFFKSFFDLYFLKDITIAIIENKYSNWDENNLYLSNDVHNKIKCLNNCLRETHVKYIRCMYANIADGLLDKDIKKILKKIEQDYDFELTIYNILNFFFVEANGNILENTVMSNIFTPIYSDIFLSVLKCESLFDDNFSNNKLRDKLCDNIKKYFNHYGAEYGSSEIVEKTFGECFSTLLEVSNLYRCLNRKIELQLSGKPVELIDDNNASDFYDTKRRYIKFMNEIETQEANKLPENNLPGFFIKTLPYLFNLLSFVTLKDLSFVIDKDDFGRLLDAYYCFKKIIILLSPIGQKIQDLKDTFILAKTKTSFLIYKIIRSDKNKLLKNYQYRIDNIIYSFDIRYKIDGKKSIVQFIDENTFKNESCQLASMFDIYDDKDVPLSSNKNFKDYELDIIRILELKQTREDKIKDICDNFLNKYKKGVVVDAKHNDIYQYNNEIINMIRLNFIIFTEPIKTLEKIQDSNEIDAIVVQIDKINKILDGRGGEEKVSSCSFLFKYLRWGLSKLSSIIAGAINGGAKGFEIIRFCERLLAEAEKLNSHIESGFYAESYASLFQDCFFCFNPDLDHPIRRDDDSIKTLMSNVYEEKSPYIFIASTWRKPISKLYLRKRIKDYSLDLNKIKIGYYDAFYKRIDTIAQETEHSLPDFDSKNTNELNETKRYCDKEIDESRRSSTQTLGILAGFISLASISVATSKEKLDTKTFIAFISGITLCFVVFVLLLNYVIKRNPQNMIERIATKAFLIIIIVTLACLIATFLL